MYFNIEKVDLVIEKITRLDHTKFAQIKIFFYRIIQITFILLVLGILYAVAAILLTAPKAILGHGSGGSFTQFGFSLTGITNIAAISALPIALFLAYKIYRARKDANLTYLQVLTYALLILSITIPFMLFWRVLIGLACLVLLVKFFYFILLPQLFLTFSSEI